MPSKKISVLIVDDSTFMRKALKRMLSSDPMIRIAGDARDGEEAIDAVKRLRPDVVTMDVKMSGMDGLQALEIIMRDTPTPVLMVSSLTSEGGGVTLKALEAVFGQMDPVAFPKQQPLENFAVEIDVINHQY